MSGRRTHAQMTSETRAKLLAAARRAFAEHGYAGTSMDELCEDAGLTRGALYHQFGSKKALLEAVVEEIDAEIGAHLDRHCEAITDPWEQLSACNTEYLRLAMNPEIQQILLRDAPAVLGQRMREIDEASSISALTEAIADLIARGRIVECDPETVARMLNGALMDAALWIAAAEDPAPRFERASKSISLLMGGLQREGGAVS
ncbi:MAG: TetR/AcrR family transcriptional regulator [Devosiaceae bacterium]|nr:TetR/AcrR family transcriptional regulator [Devosiaceae bacterium MH13]